MSWKLPAVVTSLAAILLFLPLPEREPARPASAMPFVWNQDARWTALEHRFMELRGRDDVPALTGASLDSCARLIERVEQVMLPPASPLLDSLEANLFALAPLVALCPGRLPEYLRMNSRMRAAVKQQTTGWRLNDQEARGRAYRLLYGSRAAVEEVMLQAPPGTVPALVPVADVPASTPFTRVLGATIHSGDIFVSRGAVPTSALIARGSDYPGNFSHVALVHVDERTNVASIIESHIERGVAVSTLEQYLHDVKLRVMILRVRPDLPALQSDPMLPHRAATVALAAAGARHTAYDFAMDTEDTNEAFCSEVAYDPYFRLGISLWNCRSTVSSQGVASWLAAFGVRHFQTLGPSDLEYDPQLQVVAEWRDPETLYQDHADNAVTDVMLEGAERGDRLGYSWYLLPIGRVLKGYSALLNLFGGIGPVPEGMSAEAALRNKEYTSRHTTIRARLLALGAEFQRREGFRPPYWELVAMARNAQQGL